MDILIHILLYPLYQLVSTIRHELSHVVAAKLSRLQITEVRILPHRRNGKWYWGYVGWEGEPNVHCWMAPCYVNIICLSMGIWIFNDPPEFSLHLRLVVSIMLILSPVIDTMYNLAKWWLKGSGDFAEAFKCK